MVRKRVLRFENKSMIHKRKIWSIGLHQNETLPLWKIILRIKENKLQNGQNCLKTIYPIRGKQVENILKFSKLSIKNTVRSSAKDINRTFTEASSLPEYFVEVSLKTDNLMVSCHSVSFRTQRINFLNSHCLYLLIKF